jgi:phage protein U
MTTGIGPGPQVMMTLGVFQFGISTAAYQEISRATDYRWPGQDRHLQDQALQFVGQGGDTMTLPGVIYPQWRGGFTQIETLRGIAGTGKPQLLIDGTGKVLGRWVVERIEEKSSNFAAAGQPLKIEFIVDLRKFGDIDPAAAGMISDLVTGGGAAATDAGGLADKFSGSLSGISAGLGDAMANVSAVAGQIGSTVSSVIAPISKAIDTANGLKNSIVGAKNMLVSTTTALRQAKSLTQLVNAGASAAANATQASKNLGAQVKVLQNIGTIPVQALAAVENAGVQINRLTAAASSLQVSAMDAIKKL